jgi:hypothetical protein
MEWKDKLTKDDLSWAIAGTSPAFPGSIPQMLKDSNLKFRTEKLDGKFRNELLGIIVTRPNESKLVVGDAYFDRKDNQCDETFFEYDIPTQTWTRYEGKSLEQKYKVKGFYQGSHKGNKKFMAILQFIQLLKRIK